MKINKTKSKFVVEFDEFLNLSEHMTCIALGVDNSKSVEDIIERMNELAPRRTAYNMWEFTTEEDARHALFVLGLKL